MKISGNFMLRFLYTVGYCSLGQIWVYSYGRMYCVSADMHYALSCESKSRQARSSEAKFE